MEAVEIFIFLDIQREVIQKANVNNKNVNFDLIFMCHMCNQLYAVNNTLIGF